MDDQPETVVVHAEELAPSAAPGEGAAEKGVEGRVEGLQGGDGPELATLDPVTAEVIVEELDQGLDLGELGHRPMMDSGGRRRRRRTG
jgi:hypothetical protein